MVILISIICLLLIICVILLVILNKKNAYIESNKKWLQSDERKEVFRKVRLILDNTRSLDKINNAIAMISNIIINERDEYEIMHRNTKDWIVETIFSDLEKEIDVIILSKRCQLIERKINKNR